MVKPIILNFKGSVSSFYLRKLERKKLYGSRKRIPIDSKGEVCKRAALTDDGLVLITSGMTAQGWYDITGRQVESNEIGAQDSNSNELKLVPSTLGVEQMLEGPVEDNEILDLHLESVYLLEAENLNDELSQSLKSGKVWKFAFNYRPDYRAETAFLISNDKGIFALIGVPTFPMFLSPNAPPPVDDSSEEDEADLDFEMF